MKLAYMIQAHTNEVQIYKLIEALNDINTDFFIHIDKKSDNVFKYLVDKYSDAKNVFFVYNRVDVNWSGYSQVQATINLLKLVISKDKEYDYVTLLSGQDYPIKSKNEIQRILSLNYGKEFIQYNSIGNYFWRIKCYNLFTENKNNRKVYIKVINKILRCIQMKTPRRKNLDNLDLYVGSQWFTITYSCVKYIVDYIDKNAKYISDFRYTACADEHFFQIIILNSNFKSNVINDNLRHIVWNNSSNSPKTFKIEDLDELVSSKKLFARKFDINLDQEIIDEISKNNERGL